jgi:hypothetical protein
MYDFRRVLTIGREGFVDQLLELGIAATPELTPIWVRDQKTSVDEGLHGIGYDPFDELELPSQVRDGPPARRLLRKEAENFEPIQ